MLLMSDSIYYVAFDVFIKIKKAYRPQIPIIISLGRKRFMFPIDQPLSMDTFNACENAYSTL